MQMASHKKCKNSKQRNQMALEFLRDFLKDSAVVCSSDKIPSEILTNLHHHRFHFATFHVCHSSTGRNFFKKADSSRILQEFNSEFRLVKNGGKFGIQN